MRYLVILLFIYSNSIFSKEYTLKWYSFVTILDTITYKDKSVYRIVSSDGSWEDSEGFYGALKCIGPNKISSTDEVELDVFCEAYDNKGDTFGLNLYRSSEVNSGTGIATYIITSGKYKRLQGKKCTYAITYLNNFKKGFYKHICK